MNNEMPKALDVNGCTYSIDPSFSNCLRIMEAYEDYELLDETKPLIMMDLLFDKQPPLSEEALIAAVTFLDGGEVPEAKAPGSIVAPKPRLFSFTQDMKYIRAAIQRTHGVNLRECGDMHWWKFLDMFLDLDPECMFGHILQLRLQQSKGKLTKEEKKLWAEMRDVLILKTPEYLRAEAAAADMAKELERLESLSGGVVNA